ncbi:MAG: phosphatase PAP2 family protein [Clostridia bacterium]|nr:phosphatase PAP2 family protein [Clostridia bacterium]
MERKNTRLYTIIGLSLFAVVFAALVVVATFCDLEISKILTKNALPTGAYFSTSGFGLFFEAMGSAPIYLMGSVAGIIFFWWGVRKEQKWLKILAPIVGAIAAVAGAYLFVNDAFKYVGEQFLVAGGLKKFYVKVISAVIALFIAAPSVVAWGRIKPEQNEKFIKWVLVILCTLAIYLIVHFIKTPIGRVRFRTMNYLGDSDYSYFTKWYVINGKRNLVESVDGVAIKDSCKSFPSGHTFSAGMIYTLICLPDLIESWNKKWVKGVVYGGTVAFTAVVAISRILVGAHYMSDVLFGGTMAFAGTMIFREIFLFKGEHLKALFGKTRE